MIVRNATEADLDDIARMARAFYAATSYASFTMLSDDAVRDLARTMMGTGTMLVAESDGVVVGMAGLLVLPFLFNPEKTTAVEVVWYVDSDAQGAGAGKALLAAIEPACKAAGADIIQMIHLSNSPPQAVALYERMGYHHTESAYAKEC